MEIYSPMIITPTPGPWSIDKHALGIWAPSAKGGETKIFDIRGWGYLTGRGHGALGLQTVEAKAIQVANGTLAAAAPDMLEALQDLMRIRDWSIKAGAAQGPLAQTVIVEFAKMQIPAVDKARAAIAKATL